MACAPFEIMFSMAACCAASSRSAVLTWNSLMSGRDVRRLGVRLGHLDHLGAPDVADVGVGEGDVVRRVGHLLVLHRLRAGEGLVAGGGVEAALLGDGCAPEEAVAHADGEADCAHADGRAAKDLTTTDVTLQEAIHALVPPSRH